MSIELDNIGSGFNRNKINDNFKKVEDELNNNVLRRNNLTPVEDNSMEVDLDMNSNRLLNLPFPVSETEPVRRTDLNSLVNIGGLPVFAGDVIVLDNVSAMKTTNLVSGNTAVCKRYYAGGDLVDGLVYEIQEASVVDGFVNHELTNGNVAILQYNGILEVEKAGMVGDGETPMDDSFLALLNANIPMKFAEGKTYAYVQGPLSNGDQFIEAYGALFDKVVGANGGFLFVNSGNFTMRGGIVDNKNQAANFAHLITYKGGEKLDFQDVTLLNQVAGLAENPNNPTKSIDTDLLNIQDCTSAVVKNCTFIGASRQGISLTNPTAYVEVTDNYFEDCYLFGFDMEPNNPTLFMYPYVDFSRNYIKNCGSKDPDAGNYVWNSGGPFAFSGPLNAGVKCFKTLVIKDNIVISEDFLNQNGTFVEPFAKADQFETLDFSMTARNLDRCIIATTNDTIPTSVNVKVNTDLSAGGNMQGNVFVYYGDEITVDVSGGTLITLPESVVDGKIAEGQHLLSRVNGGPSYSMRRVDTTTLEGDTYGSITTASNDTDEQGVNARIDAVKDVTNANPFCGWSFFTGRPTDLKNTMHLTFDGNLLPDRTGLRDGAGNIGVPSNRWLAAYIRNIRTGDGSTIWTSGTGTPEGVVTAVVGSMYTRTDGGAGTTLYVKESGTGNTGWVAK